MSFLKLLGSVVGLACLAGGAVAVDLVANDGNLIYGAMGRDGLVADCRPVLVRSLTEKGLDRDTIVIGKTLKLSVSTDDGHQLESELTAALPDGKRYRGTFTCQRKGADVTINYTLNQAGPFAATARS